MIVVGLLVLFLSVALLVGPAYVAGRFAAKFVGIPNYGLFDAKEPGSLPREAAIFATCIAAALLICVGANFLGELVSGETVSSNRIEVVQESPAQYAGLVDGDRVVAVDGTTTPTFDSVRTSVRRSATTHALTIERDGRHHDIAITPDARGTIGITAIQETRRTTVSGALAKAVRTPWLVWKDILLPRAKKVDLVGPVGIVRAVAHERDRGWGPHLRIVGLLNCVLIWTIPVAFLNDWLTWFLFRWRHHSALRQPGVAPRVLKMQRLHYTLKLDLIFLAVCVVGLTWADWSYAPSQSPVRVWFAWFEGALIPVLWRVCRELYRPTKVIGIVFLMFVPLANIVVIVWQMKAIKRWLNNRP